MGKADFLRLGDYNVICDQCGWKFKNNLHGIRTQWNKLRVCPQCYEERNPQDFVTGVRDDMHVPIPRPDVEPRFLSGVVNPDDLDGKPKGRS